MGEGVPTGHHGADAFVFKLDGERSECFAFGFGVPGAGDGRDCNGRFAHEAADAVEKVDAEDADFEALFLFAPPTELGAVLKLIVGDHTWRANFVGFDNIA